MHVTLLCHVSAITVNKSLISENVNNEIVIMTVGYWQGQLTIV